MWLCLQSKYWSVPILLSVPEYKDSGLSIIITRPLALQWHVWIGNCLSLSRSFFLKFLSVDELETGRTRGLSTKYLLSFFQWSFQSLAMKACVSLKQRMVGDEKHTGLLSGSWYFGGRWQKRLENQYEVQQIVHLPYTWPTKLPSWHFIWSPRIAGGGPPNIKHQKQT